MCTSTALFPPKPWRVVSKNVSMRSMMITRRAMCQLLMTRRFIRLLAATKSREALQTLRMSGTIASVKDKCDIHILVAHVASVLGPMNAKEEAQNSIAPTRLAEQKGVWERTTTGVPCLW
jgi:hypothetical protein